MTKNKSYDIVLLMNERESVIESGCKGCSNYNPKDYCKFTILQCPYLAERDLHAGRITKKEYNEHVKLTKQASQA